MSTSVKPCGQNSERFPSRIIILEARPVLVNDLLLGRSLVLVWHRLLHGLQLMGVMA